MKTLLGVFLCIASSCIAAAEEDERAARSFLRWDRFLQLPPTAGQEEQPGVAGPFSGVHNGALIVGGGANFPEGPPWEGGKKVWQDELFVMEGTREGGAWIKDKVFKLPRPLAYGTAISTADGIACIGGCDSTRCYADAFLLKWDPDK